MIKQSLSILFFLSITIVVFLPDKTMEPRYRYQLFETPDGWGYDIIINNKIVIHQPTIPALENNNGFQYKIQAGRVAELIITKIKQRKYPTVSKFEVEQLLTIKTDP